MCDKKVHISQFSRKCTSMLKLVNNRFMNLSVKRAKWTDQLASKPVESSSCARQYGSKTLGWHTSHIFILEYTAGFLISFISLFYLHINSNMLSQTSLHWENTLRKISQKVVLHVTSSRSIIQYKHTLPPCCLALSVLLITLTQRTLHCWRLLKSHETSYI